jgi:crotonobetainyl-CoA:carnitine CoA-transferase CaiB-like acyl-CoA transferase
MTQPLSGILVVALEQAVAAPYCSSRLADAGARVIKVERAEGDFARHYDHVAQGESAYFVWLNRGKESLCLNIKDERDNQLLQRILAHADVFIQNLAPGAAGRAGFDSATLRQQYSRLITVDITGYGDSGPYAQMKAYDLLVQCETGLASITGAPQQPGRVGVSVCDIACGMYAHAAVLEALIERGQTGQGKGIAVSLFDALAEWMTVPLLHQQYAGAPPQRVGLNHPSIAPYGAYPCAGEEQVVIAIQNEREWTSLCEQVLERPDIASDNRFHSNVRRCENRGALDEIITGVFSRVPRSALTAKLSAAKIGVGAVNSVKDLQHHQQLRRQLVGTPSGPVELVAAPARSSDGDRSWRPVPAIGQHTESIEAEFEPGGPRPATPDADRRHEQAPGQKNHSHEPS